MKANELRIGNWLRDNQGDFKVKALEEGVEFTDIAIPLTTEWLERAGFIKEMYDEEVWYELFYGPWIFLQGDKNGFTEVTIEGFEDSLRVKYVHQLQNLYFALTGEELIFANPSKL